MEEKWKEIEGYDGDYLVSNFGRVKSLKNKKETILKRLKHTNGYYKVGLTKNNISKQSYLHRLVGTSFIPNPENKPDINHKNGCKSDNHVANLEWVTPKQNAQHAWQTGLCDNVTNSRKIPVFSSKLNIQFESGAEAAIYLKTYYFEDIKLKSLESCIGRLLSNKVTKSKFDFGWKYVDERKAVKKNTIIPYEANKKPVFSSKLNVQFESLTEAAIYLKTYYFENIKLEHLITYISLLLTNKRIKSKYDFSWSYVNK